MNAEVSFLELTFLTIVSIINELAAGDCACRYFRRLMLEWTNLNKSMFDLASGNTLCKPMWYATTCDAEGFIFFQEKLKLHTSKARK